MVVVVVGLLLVVILSRSAKSLSLKRASTVVPNEVLVAGGFRGGTALLLLIPTALFFSVESLSPVLPLAIVNGVSLTVSTVLIVRAMSVEDVSIVAPIIALYPIAAAVPAAIFLDQIPSVVASVGVVLVIIGTYSLNLETQQEDILSPLRELWRTKGAQYAAGAIVVSSIVPVIDNFAIEVVSPTAWTFLVHSVVGLLLGVIFVVTRGEGCLDQARGEWKIVAIVAVLNAILWVSQVLAYNYTQVVYVQAVKRASLLVTVVGGGLIFDEKETKKRLISSGIILCGVILILFNV